jgi:hypothetical protein
MNHDDLVTYLRRYRADLHSMPEQAVKEAADRLDLYQTLLQRAEWQPIETAPKTGESILLGHAKGCADGRWLQAAYDGNGAWIWAYIHLNPTHWMSLPILPEARP